jgi:DNA-binding NtrC family response regulator
VIALYLPKSAGGALQVEEPVATGEPQARGETVLVIEDDEDVRCVTVRFLSRLGYQVLEACDGATADAALERTPGIDLVLSDVRLPGGRSGPDIVEEAQSHRPDLKALFMSGYTGLRMSRQGQLPEGIVLLNKPFTKHDLAQKVRAVLDE